MYKNFIKTNDGGYMLKKQGMVSTIIVGGAIAALTILCLTLYLTSQNQQMLLLTIITFTFCFIIFWRITRKFIIYPQQQIFKYSRGKGASLQEFRFDELDGATQDKVKNMYGFTTGNSFKLGFEQNGKYKAVLLGQNVSAKKMRSIGEEINAIMKENG